MGFTPHAAEYQTPLKASYDIVDEADYLSFLDRSSDRRSAGQGAVFQSHQTGCGAGKGRQGYRHRVSWSLNLACSSNHVVVAGDSGNDMDMFIDPFRGIVVGNADDDLRSFRRKPRIFCQRPPCRRGPGGIAALGCIAAGKESNYATVTIWKFNTHDVAPRVRGSGTGVWQARYRRASGLRPGTGQALQPVWVTMSIW